MRRFEGIILREATLNAVLMARVPYILVEVSERKFEWLDLIVIAIVHFQQQSETFVDASFEVFGKDLVEVLCHAINR